MRVINIKFLIITNKYLHNHPPTGLTLPLHFSQIDLSIAILLSSSLLVGITGNLLAFLYFIKKPRWDVSTFLYVAICAVDFCTCAIQPPIIVTLASGRTPGLFATLYICTAWCLAFEYCQRISMFLVMLLSASRCIAIVWPFAARRKRHLIGVLVWFVGYVLFIAVHNAVTWHLNTYQWRKDTPYCYHAAKDGTDGIAVIVDELLYATEVGFPQLVAFVTFLISTFVLMNKARGSTTVRTSRRASVTITIFTGLVLGCNLPYFNSLLLFALEVGIVYPRRFEYPGPIFRSDFMFWYAWLLSKVVLVVLNAATNPLVYVWRMKDFRSWVLTGKGEAIGNSKLIRTRKVNSYSGNALVIANRGRTSQTTVIR